MDFRNAAQLVGDYHHVEVSPNAYLDIHKESPMDIIVNHYTSADRPVLTFDATNKNQLEKPVVSSQSSQSMIEAIK